MKCFTVYADEIEGRIDPHFYKPEFRKIEANLKKQLHMELGAVIEFSNEIWNQNDFFDNEFPYIEISKIDITSGEIQNITYYAKLEAPSRAKMIVKEGDIIVSTTRPHRGAIALIGKEKDGFIVSTGFAILRKIKTDIDKRYLLFFLRTQLSLKQMLQRSSGGNYPAITSEELKRIIIPLPPIAVQNKIVKLMEDVYSHNKQKEVEAQQLLDSINDYVLDELGIKMPELRDKMVYVVNIDKVQNKRVDAYYYQPKFEEVEKAIKKGKFELVKVGSILEYYKKGVEVGSDAYIEEGVPFIRVSDIDDYKINYEKVDKKISIQVYDKLIDYNPKKDELLYSKDGSVGFCLVVNEDKKAIISGGILRLKVKKNTNNFYVKSILCNKFFKILSDRESIGSIIKHLTPEVFFNFKIPLPPLTIQNKIAEEVKAKMKKAEKLQKEAKEELEEAKQEVEKIILGEKTV